MLRNYFKVAVRAQFRNKGTALINVVGLSLGLVSFLLILLYLQAEYSYDTASPFSDDIYRVQTTLPDSPGGGFAFAPLNWSTQFASEFPEIMSVMRLSIPGSGDLLVQYEEVREFEPHRFAADSTLFSFFGVKLAQGDSETALSAPKRAILSQALAQKYFKNESPVGKTLTLDNQTDVEVTGVMASLPNMHVTLDLVISHDTPELEGWGWTYIRVLPGTDPIALTEKVNALHQEINPEAFADIQFELMPLEGIHLHSHLLWEIEPNGNATYVQLFAIVAALILLIACINFVNLATARSMGRAKEVGMRKVLGARKVQLIRQYLIESVLLASLSVVIAALLLPFVVPAFEAFAGVNLAFSLLSPGVWLGLAALVVGVGVVSGLYPAFYLSSFRPARVLKGKASSSRSPQLLRQGLVVFQFAISAFLIAGTGLINLQLDFLKNQDLGYGADQVLVVPIRDDVLRAQVPAIKERLQQHPNVLSVAATTNIPGQYGMMPNQPLWGEGMPLDENIQTPEFVADEDFLETMGLELVAGRNFSPELGTDADHAFIINESAIRAFGWDDPIGKTIRSHMQEGTVVGVIKDFHLKSLHESIGPVSIEFHGRVDNWWERVLAVRIRSTEVSETLAFLQSTWAEIDPARPFDYAFMDDEFNQQYVSEEKLEVVFYAFSGMGILIACLGLFGLAAYAAEQRTKEIGIRKVLGATVPTLVGNMTWDLVRLVLLAFAVSTPLIVWAMKVWLRSFSYHTDISVLLFAGTGFLAVGIAVITVGYQAIRSSLLNPVDVLRHE